MVVAARAARNPTRTMWAVTGAMVAATAAGFVGAPGLMSVLPDAGPAMLEAVVAGCSCTSSSCPTDGGVTRPRCLATATVTEPLATAMETLATVPSTAPLATVTASLARVTVTEATVTEPPLRPRR